MAALILAVNAAEFPLIEEASRWHFGSFADRSLGENTADNLVADILSEKRQCWIAWDGDVQAVALTQVQDNPLQTVEMTHCAGKGRGDWQDEIVKAIREWARLRGSKRFRVINRPGWTKHLKKLGLRETHRVMEQDIA